MNWNAWGVSWGVAWGVSWGQDSSPPAGGGDDTAPSGLSGLSTGLSGL